MDGMATTIDARRSIESLVTHIELHQAGWWNRVVNRLIVASIWFSERSLSSEEIINDLLEAKIPVLRDTIAKEITVLCDRAVIICLPNNTYKLSECARKDIFEDVAENNRVIKEAKSYFLQLLLEISPSLTDNAEEIWEKFNVTVLRPLLEEMGASTFYLVSGERGTIDSSNVITSFLKPFSSDIRKALREVIIQFINPSKQDVRSYILRLVNINLCLMAGNLSQRDIQSIIQAMENPPAFDVYVDTNFIFSAIGLHKSQANDAVESLLAMVKELPARIQIRFIILPHTLREAEHAIMRCIEQYEMVRYRDNIVSSLQDTDCIQFAKQFKKACEEVGISSNSNEYYREYLQNLRIILENKGIVYSEADLGQYRQDLRVINATDELLKQDQVTKLWKDSGRTSWEYDVIEHDMLLWHYVSDLRPPRVDSPLNAKHWIVTSDYHRLIRFDKSRLGDLPSAIPVCIVPLSLIQMWQFWIPRSDKFEQTLIGSLRLPFFMQEFDGEAERLTMDIVHALVRQDKAAELPPQTIQKMLTDKAMRQRFIIAKTKEDKQEIVRDYLATENARLTHELLSMKDTIHKVSDKLEQTIEKYGDESNAKNLAKQELEEEQGRLRSAIDEKSHIDNCLQVTSNRLKAIETVVRKVWFVFNCLFLIALSLYYWKWQYQLPTTMRNIVTAFSATAVVVTCIEWLSWSHIWRWLDNHKHSVAIRIWSYIVVASCIALFLFVNAFISTITIIGIFLALAIDKCISYFNNPNS